MTHLSLFQLCPPTAEIRNTFGITTVNLLHGVTLPLSQCMFTRTKLLRFSIWPKTCLSDTASDERFSSIHPMSNLLILLCKTKCQSLHWKLWSHTSIILIIWLFLLNLFDLIHSCHRACPSGKVHETFQTYIWVFSWPKSILPCWFINAVFSRLSAPVGLRTVPLAKHIRKYILPHSCKVTHFKKMYYSFQKTYNSLRLLRSHAFIGEEINIIEMY